MNMLAEPAVLRDRTSLMLRTEVLLTADLGIARQDEAYYHGVMRTISLKLPDDLLARLSSQAKARRLTKSSLIRESLVKTLYEQPSSATVSCYDVARDLAGTVKGLPEDLGHDPTYMEGFGR